MRTQIHSKSRAFVIFPTLMLLLLVFNKALAQGEDSNKEYRKLAKLFAGERHNLKSESCKECSYVSLIKVYLNKKRELDSLQFSYSTPLSLAPLSEKIKALNINWGNLIEKSSNKSVLIIPLFYLNTVQGGKIIFASANDFSNGVYEFKSGSLFKNDINQYYWLNPINISTTSEKTEGTFKPRL